jgi:hypothetical protein
MTFPIDLCKVKSDRKVLISAVLLMCIALTGCFKKDSMITLPPKTGSTILIAPIGKLYDSTSYINLASGKIISKVSNLSWDLKFACDPTSFSILLNSGKNVRSFETAYDQLNQVNSVTGQPQLWGFDEQTNLNAKAYLNRWTSGNGVSKFKVYIVKVGDGLSIPMAYYKLRILSANASQFVFEFDTLTGNQPKTEFIYREPSKSYVHFSLATQSIQDVEPAKTDWDICMTRYAEIFYLNPTIVYPVNGVLLNPYKTQGWGDTMNPRNYLTFNADSAEKIILSSNVNSIGYTWKKFENNQYNCYPEFLYLVKTQEEALYKLHFLDWYSQGIGGNPKLEFERIK